MDYDIVPPDPAGMVESLSALGYTLESAVADLVDNSIDADAKHVDVIFHWAGLDSYVAVVDDGRGMTEGTLLDAMAIALKGPRAMREVNDLGRFGMGLKTASFSQARMLTVWSRSANAEPATRVWDLDHVLQCGDWQLLHKPDQDTAKILDALAGGVSGSGTVVLWRRLTKMVDEFGAIDDQDAHGHFLEAIARVDRHLGMTFERFLATRRGRARKRSMVLAINSAPVPAWDPFMAWHDATLPRPIESLEVDGHRVVVRPYVLPPKRRLTDEEYRSGAGPRGWLEQQPAAPLSGGRGKSKRGPKLAPLPKQAARAASSPAQPTQPAPTAPKIVDKNEAWKKSRHGAQAGRGFHFQDAIGAWLAVGMLTRAVDVDRLVPEGFEDLGGEGGKPVDWQVKSRQDRVGEFSARDVSKYALKLSREQADRGSTARPVLVLERGIKDSDLPVGATRIDDLTAGHPLRAAMKALLDEPHTTRSEVDRASRLVEVVVVSNTHARRDAVTTLAVHYNVQPAIAEKILLAIRDHVANCVDTNATVGVADRAYLDRTAIEAKAQATLNDIDPSALTEATRTGACLPLDLDSPLSDDQYYLGLDAQPGHIAAGLPAQRPALTGAIATALATNHCVLITGPSGVGKSTAMWAAAAHTSHITWFQVMRLDDDDIEPIARLATALRPTEQTPVGFVVDAVGLGAAPAWDRLVERLASVPNVRLLGTARTEDLVALRSLASTTTVDVHLDEDVAAAIFEGLRQSGATQAKHWREAYENCHELTLEFTHYLTQGRRLDDVLTGQIKRRVREERDLELKILALVSMAHSCGLALPLGDVQQELAASDTDIRLALASLADEHLVRESGGALSGLHQLRSLALVEAVHAHPPPLRAQTLATVLTMVEPREVPQMLISALYRWPDLDDAALTAVQGLLTDATHEGTSWTGILVALRIVDFQRLANSWTTSAPIANLPPTDRSVSVQLAMATDMDDLDILKPGIRAAVRTIRASLTPTSPLRDQQLVSLGATSVAARLEGIGHVRQAAAFLAAVNGFPMHLTGALNEGSAFAQALMGSTPDELGELLYLAAQSSPDLDLARRIQDLAGGEAAVLERIMDAEPTLLEVRRMTTDDGDVAYGRLLHVSDQLDPDSSGTTKRVARLLLRSLPGTVAADVETTIARDTPFEVGGHNFHVSHLLSKYALTSLDVDWNVTRSFVALDAMGTMTPTERAHAAVAVLENTARYLWQLLGSWVTLRRTDAEATLINETRKQCLSLRATLTIPIESRDFLQRALPSAMDRMSHASSGLHETDAAAGASGFGSTLDDLDTLIHSVCRVVTDHLEDEKFSLVAAHLDKVVVKTLPAIRDGERWDLAGLAGAPDSLEQIGVMLTQLRTIAAALGFGGLSLAETRKEARRVKRSEALRVACDYAERFKRNWLAGRLHQLTRRADARGVTVRTITRALTDPDSHWPESDLVVVVSCEHLDGWVEALPVVDELVLSLRAEANFPETMVIPVVGGHTISKLARRLIQSAWPGEAAVDDWADKLPPIAATPLSDAVVAVTGALMPLSGIAYLATRRELAPDVVEEQQKARDALAAGFAAILTLGRDPVIEAVISDLAQLSDLVEAEYPDSNGETVEPPGAYAAEVGRALAGTENEVNAFLAQIQGVALGWDLDHL